MSGPSIIFINRVYPPQRGATGRLLKDLAHAFAQEGWQVTIITTGPKTKKEKDNSIQIIRTKGPEHPRLLHYPWLWIKLLFLSLRAGDADLIVSMTDPPMTAIIGKIAANIKKAKHIHWCQDYYPGALRAIKLKPPGFLYRMLKKTSTKTLKSCDQIITIGRCMAKRLHQDGVASNRITIIPNWPDPVLMRNNKKEAHHFNNASSDAAMRIGSKPHALQMKSEPKFRILYAGNIGRAHPVQPILEAATLLQEPHPEIEFTFVGDGKRFDALAIERDKRGLQNIRFLPFQPEESLPDIMESGDLHLISMADRAAGYMVPCKFYAALAACRPVIFLGPDQCEIAKILHEFEAGETVPPGHGSALAETIKNFRIDGDLWFKAYEGASRARQHIIPDQATKLWIKKSLSVIQGVKIDGQSDEFKKHQEKHAARL